MVIIEPNRARVSVIVIAAPINPLKYIKGNASIKPQIETTRVIFLKVLSYPWIIIQLVPKIFDREVNNKEIAKILTAGIALSKSDVKKR